MPRSCRAVRVWPILLLPLTGPVHAADIRPQPLTIAVEVHDYAEIPAWRWRLARGEVERMFARLDLRIAWTINPTEALPAPTPGAPNVTVLILSRAMVRAKCEADHLADMVLGSSARSAGRAWVFYDRIAEAGDASGVNVAVLLARTITHELGHLIAGLPHSEYGVMRAYAELIPAGFQEFQEPQRRAMREAVSQAPISPSSTSARRTIHEGMPSRAAR